jgi:hypothetical protein
MRYKVRSFITPTYNIIRIQSVWRGYKARRFYRQLLLAHPPSVHSKSRKTFYAAKLEKLTDDLIDSIESERAALEQEMAVMEAKTKKFKDFLREVEVPKIRIEWTEVKKKALEREDTDCPICIMPLCIQYRIYRSRTITCLL